jgi:hypothetical protein
MSRYSCQCVSPITLRKELVENLDRTAVAIHQSDTDVRIEQIHAGFSLIVQMINLAATISMAITIDFGKVRFQVWLVFPCPK